MDARPKTSTFLAKVILVIFTVIVVSIFLTNARMASSTVHGQGERVFENAVPKDLPFKIKIKKEKEESYKDLKNEKWLSEFELELTNTGDKPIYFLYLTLISDVRVGGQRLVFPQVYGRAALGDIVTKAAPNDIPIQPGETYVFKMGEMPAWEKGVWEHRFPQATRLRAELQSLSFGDGTGFFGNHPYPPAGTQQSASQKSVMTRTIVPSDSRKNIFAPRFSASRTSVYSVNARRINSARVLAFVAVTISSSFSSDSRLKSN
jgi:hypothetical protein